MSPATMLNTGFIKRLSGLVILLVLLSPCSSAFSDNDAKDSIPARYGLSFIFGKPFDPVDDIFFIQLSGFIMWDHSCPK